MKKLGAAVLTALILTAVSGVSEASSLTGIRVVNGTGQSRIVLDMKDRPESWDVSFTENEMTLTLPHTENKNTEPVQYEGSQGVLKGIRLQAKGDSMDVIFSMTEPVHHHVFALSDPDRIVLDAYTREEEKIRSSISDRLALTRWLKADDDGRQRLTVVEAKANQPMTVITGSKESLKATKNSAGTIAVGGNTPDQDGIYVGKQWKTGLSHDSGAVVYIPGFGYDIGFLEAQIEAALPDGQRLLIHGINRKRKENELILYTKEYGDKTGTNAYGAELLIDKNTVIRKGKGNMAVQGNQYILSGHGTMEKALRNVAVGTHISRHWHIPDKWKKASLIYGGGLWVLQNGKPAAYVQEASHQKNAPWTLLGVTASHDLIVLAIDGWQGASVGMNLEEAVSEIKKLGAVQAIALRNQGKTAVAYNGELVNRPPGKEPEFSAILVFKE